MPKKTAEAVLNKICLVLYFKLPLPLKPRQGRNMFMFTRITVSSGAGKTFSLTVLPTRTRLALRLVVQTFPVTVSTCGAGPPVQGSTYNILHSLVSICIKPVLHTAVIYLHCTRYMYPDTYRGKSAKEEHKCTIPQLTPASQAASGNQEVLEISFIHPQGMRHRKIVIFFQILQCLQLRFKY